MKKGFTLLELLVVIGIIAVLISMAAVSYSSAQKKARDARRRADISAIQKGMEQYYSLCNSTYPILTGGSYQPASTTPIDATTVTASCNGNTAVILKSMPQDPLGIAYTCVNCSATTYIVCPPVKTGAGPANGNSFYETSQSNYATHPEDCVSNQQ